MAFKLYTYPGNFRAEKSLIAAQYAGLKIDVPEEFKFPGDCRTDEFQAKNPVQKVPVLETPDGCLYESNAILRAVARYRPESNLAGRSFYEQALVDQWLDFSANEVEPPRNIWIYPLMGYMKYNERAGSKAKNDFSKVMEVVEAHLMFRTFLVGDRISLADIALGSALIAPFKKVLDAKFRSKFTNVTRWFTTLVNQPEWKTVIGSVSLCENEEKPVVEKKQKQAKQPKAKAKKEDKPAAAATQAPKKKEKNPLDLLPKSNMDMDTTKRTFSNNPFPEALKMFWDAYDAEGFCCYTANYDYNKENTVDFQTSNLVSGWLQRLDSTRKYGFGAVNIFGKEDTSGPFVIKSAWVFRGPKAPFEFTDCPDSEYHTLAKVDLSVPAEKQKFEELLGGKDECDGEPLYERKYFK